MYSIKLDDVSIQTSKFWQVVTQERNLEQGIILVNPLMDKRRVRFIVLHMVSQPLSQRIIAMINDDK